MLAQQGDLVRADDDRTGAAGRHGLRLESRQSSGKILRVLATQRRLVHAGLTWEGKGQAGGPVYWKQETIAESLNCIFVQEGDPLAPLVDTPGYSLDWFRDGPHKGEYVFTTGEITIPATSTYGCNGDTSTDSEDFQLGGGSSYYQPIPASGYHLIGDVVMPGFNGFNDAQFHWDLQPDEFYPISSNPCAAEAIYGENSVQTQLLRKYRDNVLSKTPEGQTLIKLYYYGVPL